MARAAIIAYIRCLLQVSHTQAVTGEGDRSIPPSNPSLQRRSCSF